MSNSAELLVPLSDRVASLKASLEDFVERRCQPNEELYEAQVGANDTGDRWASIPPIMEELKAEARELGLWNLWLPKEFPMGAGLSNSEYAVLAEVCGAV